MVEWLWIPPSMVDGYLDDWDNAPEVDRQVILYIIEQAKNERNID